MYSENKGADQLRSYCMVSKHKTYLSLVMRKPFFFAYAKTKTQVSFAITARLYAFVFTIRIVQYLY